MRILLIIWLTVVISGCQTTEKNQQQSALALLSASIKKDKFLAEKYSPFANPMPGKTNRKLPDLSPETLQEQHESYQQLLTEIKSIKSDSLSQANRINLGILRYKTQNTVDNYLNGNHYIPLMAESGFHANISFISSQSTFKSHVDYEDYLARLAALPTYFDQQMYWMQEGLSKGISQPQIVLDGFENSIKAFIHESPEESVYYGPFKSMSKYIDEEDQAELREAAVQIISEYVFPAYQSFYDFMVNTYIPNARKDIAAKSLPNGEAFYQNRVKHYTTTDLTGEQVHNIGLDEVARIRSEMEEIIKQLEFDGSFAEFVEYLRTDEQFYAKSAEELLKEASYIAKKIDAKLPAFFKKLPRSPYGVKEVPASIAPKYTTGRYQGASRDDQPGYYWVNTYALERRPLYVLDALTLHEAVPGHHLQIALSKEQQGVPEFRRQTYISAFGEGWALYGEWLGIEMGIYSNLYSQFGRLTYEMWRACRLVVDTGMHIKGWSRQEAIDYLASNTALSLHNVTTEIDRYISWPGQALSYKMGELTIKRLRKKAEDALEENFDIREFHDEILKHGSIPLSVLEEQIDKYIAYVKKRS